MYPKPDVPNRTRRFECHGCLTVVVSEERQETCPECGHPMRNVSVARE